MLLPADFVIGADGHKSVVQKAITPEHGDATFAGYVVWLATINEHDLPDTIQGDRRLADGVFLGSDFLLAAGCIPDTDGTNEPGHRTVGWAIYDNTHNLFFRDNGNVRDGVVHHSVGLEEITPQLRQQLAATFESHWPSPWKEVMVASLRANLVLGTPITEYVPTRLVDGRIAIVGDAAYVATPMTGRGYTEALDDAETLADAIARARRSHTTVDITADALHRYEKKRLRKARGTVESGQNFSRRFRPAA